MACRSDLPRDMSTDKNKEGSVLVERESTGANADRPILRTFTEAAGCKQVCAFTQERIFVADGQMERHMGGGGWDIMGVGMYTVS